MTDELKGQVALVTGGAKGFGRGIAAALQTAGAQVTITGRDQDALDEAVEDLGVRAVQADVTSPGDWDRVVSDLLEHSGRIDILVNNAGGGILIAPTEGQTDAAIDAVIALNLTGPIYGCRRIAPLMRKQKSGTIVNISSSAAHYAWPTWGVYGGAKAGLNHFSRSLYAELRPHGVRVTTISPSWGATGFTDAAGIDGFDADTVARSIQPHELGKLVQDICVLPAHLCLQETILWPLVQEVSPM
jgi:NAD(P)-dependent dehydrogenase (short-subunit alcohol dehydrogenase family)